MQKVTSSPHKYAANLHVQVWLVTHLVGAGRGLVGPMNALAVWSTPGYATVAIACPIKIVGVEFANIGPYRAKHSNSIKL